VHWQRACGLPAGLPTGPPLPLKKHKRNRTADRHAAQVLAAGADGVAAELPRQAAEAIRGPSLIAPVIARAARAYADM